MFLKNYWYVAARAEEISRTPLARTIPAEPVVLFRRENRSLVALEDCCVHRSLPRPGG
jgi:vanillate O-demethylase monooxygenase subunit